MMHKCVDLRAMATKLQIISAFAVEHIRGFVFIEADKLCDILEVPLLCDFIKEQFYCSTLVSTSLWSSTFFRSIQDGLFGFRFIPKLFLYGCFLVSIMIFAGAPQEKLSMLVDVYLK